MKKAYPILVLIFIFCLCACGENEKDNVVTESSEIRVDTEEYNVAEDDLVHRDFGDSAIQADKGSNITITIKNALDELDSIYVHNCKTGEDIKLPVSRTVDYPVEDGGYYRVYAVTVTGEFTDLSDSAAVSHVNGAELTGGMSLGSDAAFMITGPAQK